jgi:hypothetical protein
MQEQLHPSFILSFRWEESPGHTCMAQQPRPGAPLDGAVSSPCCAPSVLCPPPLVSSQPPPFFLHHWHHYLLPLSLPRTEKRRLCVCACSICSLAGTSGPRTILCPGLPRPLSSSYRLTRVNSTAGSDLAGLCSFRLSSACMQALVTATLMQSSGTGTWARQSRHRAS